MGVVVSSSHVVFAAPSTSGGGLLTLFPCSSIGSLSWETVLHELLKCESFQNRLLQRGSPVGSQVLPANLLQRGLLSAVPQVLPGACSCMGFPRSHSLLWASSCSGMGSSTGCRWISAPPCTRMGHRDTACLMPWSSSWAAGESLLQLLDHPPPSSLNSVSAGLFLSHHLTPLSRLLFQSGFFAS